MSVEVTVRFWAGAQRAAGTAETTVTAATIEDLRTELSSSPEMAKVCGASSFLVDGVQAGENTRLHAGAVVDVLPPFAGG